MTNNDALLEGRVLRWPECLNARDLGGLPAHDGLESHAAIQRGRVVRTEVPVYLTEAGWRALLAHGVRTVIDLRSPIEIEMDGYTLPAYASGVEHLEIAMLPQDAEMSRLLESTTYPGEEYILFVERYRERIANVLRALAAVAEFGGGMTLIVGLLPRLASRAILSNMVVAPWPRPCNSDVRSHGS